MGWNKIIAARWWLAALLCCGLIGCGNGGSSVSATANVPAQFSHVYITIEQLWVSKNANAAFDDPDWQKFPLDDPQTLDLVGLTNGALSRFASEQPLPPDTYRSMRLVLSSTEGSLRRSARDAGIMFNNEVDIFDSNNMPKRVALAVVNHAQGVGFPIKLKVDQRGRNLLIGTGTGTASTTTGGSGTTATDGSGTTTIGGSGTMTTTTAGTTTTTTGGSSGDNSRITARAGLVFDAARDITVFNYSDVLGFVLNPSFAGRDLDRVGSISGQLNISAIPPDPNTGRPDIQVTAEALSADKSRRVPVMSTAVKQDGSFTIFPLPFDPKDKDIPTQYDLVVHGPHAQTVIIQSAPVTMGATGTTLTGVTVAATPAFAINIADDQLAAPRGARIGFYQTLPGRDDAPFLIEEKLLDPLSGRFAIDQSLPTGNVLVGAFTSGMLGTFSMITPVEGTSSFRVAANTPVNGDGAFGTTVTPTGANTTREFTGPTVGVPATALASTVTVTLNITSPGRYNRGALLITQDGALIDAVRIDTLLSQPSGTVVLNTLPGGSATQPFTRGAYFAEVFVWQKSDAENSFNRQPSDTPIDLRMTNTAALTLTVN